jgi:hypothetical protein
VPVEDWARPLKASDSASKTNQWPLQESHEKQLNVFTRFKPFVTNARQLGFICITPLVWQPVKR